MKTIVSVPRRGFMVFLLARVGFWGGEENLFQSPEGDSWFFYDSGLPRGETRLHVSVPRRGFMVFLRSSKTSSNRVLKGFSPPKGIHGFSTRKYGFEEGDTNRFQSPEGDSWFFYRSTIAQWPCSLGQPRFQSPEGDSWFFYSSADSLRVQVWPSFSPPKGIHGFSTLRVCGLCLRPERFQSPEGDSWFFYQLERSDA